MLEPRLFIPFADGVIGYDCVACGAGCCRGGWFRMTQPESEHIFRHHPRLALFAVGGYDDKQRVRISKADPACFFLQPDLKCSIHVEHGRDRKPLACRMHPVYMRPLLAQGTVLATMAPGCHWVTGPDLSRAIGVLSWAEARAHHEETLAQQHYEPADPPPPWTGVDLGAWLALEAQIRDRTTTFSDATDFLAWQLAFTDRALPQLDPAVVVDEAAQRRARARLATLEGHILRFLGLDALPPAPPALERQFILAGSMLRVTLLGLIYPPHPVATAIPLAAQYRLLPKMLLALYLWSRALASLRVASIEPPDYNSLVDMIRKMGGRFYVMGSFANRVALRDGAPADAAQLAEALLASIPPGAVLGDALVPATAALRTPDRLNLLDTMFPAWSALALDHEADLVPSTNNE